MTVTFHLIYVQSIYNNLKVRQHELFGNRIRIIHIHTYIDMWQKGMEQDKSCFDGAHLLLEGSYNSILN